MWILIALLVIFAFAAVGEYMYFTKKLTAKDQEIKELKYKNNVK